MAFHSSYYMFSEDSDYDTINKIFLGGIPTQTSEKELEEFFTQFGKVIDVRIVMDRLTGTCKGYGFVTFAQDEDIEHLVQRKSVRLKGNRLRIRKAIRKNKSQFNDCIEQSEPPINLTYMLKQTTGIQQSKLPNRTSHNITLQASPQQNTIAMIQTVLPTKKTVSMDRRLSPSLSLYRSISPPPSPGYDSMTVMSVTPCIPRPSVLQHVKSEVCYPPTCDGQSIFGPQSCQQIVYLQHSAPSFVQLAPNNWYQQLFVPSLQMSNATKIF